MYIHFTGTRTKGDTSYITHECTIPLHPLILVYSRIRDILSCFYLEIWRTQTVLQVGLVTPYVP